MTEETQTLGHQVMARATEILDTNVNLLRGFATAAHRTKDSEHPSRLIAATIDPLPGIRENAIETAAFAVALVAKFVHGDLSKQDGVRQAFAAMVPDESRVPDRFSHERPVHTALDRMVELTIRAQNVRDNTRGTEALWEEPDQLIRPVRQAGAVAFSIANAIQTTAPAAKPVDTFREGVIWSGTGTPPPMPPL